MDKVFSANGLSGKLFVITGASRGLGAALSQVLIEAGAGVIGIARHPFTPIGLAEAITANVAQSRGREQVCKIIGGRKIDGLIHCAGILGPRVPISRYPADAWDEVLQVNLTAVFRLTQDLLPSVNRPGGVIVTISSGAGRRAAPEWGAYAVSKFGIDGFALLLNEELAADGIRVHSINPKGMRTGMRAEAYPKEDAASVRPPKAAAEYILSIISQQPDYYPVLLEAD